MAIAMLASGGALQAATPAGTQIRNQASATYLDSAGRPQVSTSNEVINVVAPVYGLTITPDSTGGDAPGVFGGTPALLQSAAAGNIVYYSYYLANDGNVADTFQLRYFLDQDAPTRVRVYHDVDGSGLVDPGDVLLLDSGALAENTFAAASTVLVPRGASIPLVVEVTIPTTASGGEVIDVDIDARSVGADTNLSVDVTDEISNFSRTTVVQGEGIVALFKSVDKAAASPEDTLTYTIQGSNVGSIAVWSREWDGTNVIVTGAGNPVHGVLIDDVINEDFLDIASIDFSDPSTYKSFTNARFLFGTDTGLYAEADTAADAVTAHAGIATIADIDRVAVFIPAGATGASEGAILAPGQACSFTFQVELNDADSFTGASAVTTVVNRATAKYKDKSDGDGGTDQEKTSNEARTVVDNSADPSNIQFSLSPYTFTDTTLPGVDTPVTTGSNRAAQQHPEVDSDAFKLLTIPAGQDRTVADNRSAGEFFSVPVTVSNEGAVTDTYNITHVRNAALTTAGYNIYLFKSDGVTPLSDTTGNGIADTGPIAAGGFADIVVKFLIPADAVADANDKDLTITATSAANASTNDTVIRILNVRPAGVDIAVDAQTFASGTDTVAAHDPNAAGADGDADLSTDPGTQVTVDVEVRNVRAVNGTQEERRTGSPDTYTLTWASPAGSVASEWNLDYYRAGGNQPISDTGDLDPDAKRDLQVRISIPDNFPAGTYRLDLTARSSNDPSAVVDTMYVFVTVNEIPRIKIEPDNTATAIRGGTVTFSHVVSNIGNTDEDVTLTIPTVPAGFQAVFVTADGTVLGNTITSAEVAGLDLAPGEDVEVFVRVFVPQNAPVGSSNVFIVLAEGSTLDPVDPVTTDEAVDIVIVIDGNLALLKQNTPGATVTVPPTSTSPDLGTLTPTPTDYLYPITYRTTFRNLGADSIRRVVIVDQIPANTRLVVSNTTNNVNGPPANSGDADAPTFDVAGVNVDNAPTGLLIEYSTNGGVTWSDSPPAAAADGSAASVTHIRFVLNRTNEANAAAALAETGNVLLPDENGWVEFTVLVN